MAGCLVGWLINECVVAHVAAVVVVVIVALLVLAVATTVVVVVIVVVVCPLIVPGWLGLFIWE